MEPSTLEYLADTLRRARRPIEDVSRSFTIMVSEEIVLHDRIDQDRIATQRLPRIGFQP